MSTSTKNYGFVKPELTDVADITAMNQNWDIIDEKLKEKYDANNKPTLESLGAASSSHDHDSRYYTRLQINEKISGLPASDHTHDDRYYTETEIDNLLKDKAPTTHKHTKSEITDFPTTENWTFTLEDGSTVTKAVYVG